MDVEQNKTGDLYCLKFADGKLYIGACVCGSKQRYKNHQRDVNKGSTKPVHNAWRKLGPPILVILKSHVPEKKLWLMEKAAIIQYNTKIPNGYNSHNGSEKPPGGLGKSHIVKEEARKRIRAGNLGLKRTPQQIENNRLAHLGQKPTKEQNEKNSKSTTQTVCKQPVP